MALCQVLLYAASDCCLFGVYAYEVVHHDLKNTSVLGVLFVRNLDKEEVNATEREIDMR